jgi:predicted transcriptional regulator
VTYTSKQPLSSLPPTLETKIDSLENAISKMKLPTNSTTTNKQNTNSMSSKNAQVSVIESLHHPKLKSVAIEEWSSEQVAFWLLQVGFDKEIASNFKGKQI